MEMLVGLPYLLGQTAAMLVIAAVLAAGVGWFIGRGSRRRSEEALERALAAFRRLDLEMSMFAPSAAAAATPDPSQHLSPGTTDRPSAVLGMAHLGFGVAPIQHVPLQDEVESPDVTVLRPAPTVSTPLPLPDNTVIRPAPHPTPTRSGPDATIIRSVHDATADMAPDATVLRPTPDPTAPRPAPDATIVRPAADGTVIRRPAHSSEGFSGPGTVIRPAPGAPFPPTRPTAGPASDDMSSLRPDRRDPDLEAGRIEAAALAAWDRTVPMLQQQVRDLAAQNDELRRRVREAEE
jgi:hypothetical protein